MRDRFDSPHSLGSRRICQACKTRIEFGDSLLQRCAVGRRTRSLQTGKRTRARLQQKGTVVVHGAVLDTPPNVADLDLRPEVASAGLLGVGGGALGRRYTHEVGVRRHMGFHDRLGLRESSRIAGAIGRVGVDERFLARWR